MEAWGYSYKSNIVWHKIRKDGGPDGRGVGCYFRNVTEMLLFGVREAGHAQAVAAKVIAAAGAPFTIDGRDILIGASVGVALGASSGWQELVARADGQLYRAKEAGRGRQAG